jgi:predicted metalloprotease
MSWLNLQGFQAVVDGLLPDVVAIRQGGDWIRIDVGHSVQWTSLVSLLDTLTSSSGRVYCAEWTVR